jgi:hypothetical protein
MLDMVFSRRPREGHVRTPVTGAQAGVKHVAMNLMRSTKSTVSLEVRRKRASWNTGYLGDIPGRPLEKSLRQFPCAHTAPSLTTIPLASPRTTLYMQLSRTSHHRATHGYDEVCARQ